jgi:hypothetical protein
MDQNQERRRGHFHRGRRGPDRRAFDRRAQPPQPQGRDHVDVEQIMRDIRARIALRQGMELSNQQIDELAARRLEYILDPRGIKAEFLETLRRAADDVVAREEPRPSNEPVYVFEDSTLYDSHRWILRFVRRLLGPVLKLFFNPNPLIRALHLQAKLNVEAAERDAARERRQAEWNALHYRLIQRVVTETSRLSLELQALSLRIESLVGRIDYNDRRVRVLEGAAPPARSGGRPADIGSAPTPGETAAPVESADVPPVEGARRRRRRRRGRRPPMPGDQVLAVHPASAPAQAEEPALTDATANAPHASESSALESDTVIPYEHPETTVVALPPAEPTAPAEPSSEAIEYPTPERPEE